jgi:hypothetical protein
MTGGGIRIVKHEAVPDCGSFEVAFADGRESRYFYFEDLPGPGSGRSSSPANALGRAKAFARAERDKGWHQE